MQSTMSAIESYVLSDNGNVGPTTYDNPDVAVYKQVITPPLSAPINPYSAGSGDGNNAVVTPPALDGEKKKRGRPRKYPIDGIEEAKVEKVPGSYPMTVNGKRKGRPPGSVNKKSNDLMGSSVARFAPQIITVQAGEDVSSKIMLLFPKGSQAVCIMSANGGISNVMLSQASASGGTVTYEGHFEILSLSGSLVLLESGGQRSRTGGLSILLAGPDGRLFGGGVSGFLIAATPVQVVVGSFVVGQETKSPNQAEYSAGRPKPILENPIMRGTPLSDSSGSPINNQSNNSNNHGMGTMQWK